MSHHRSKCVVITGASSGIGRASALAFADKGYQLVLTARRREALDELAADCRRRGAKVLVAPADVTDAAAVAQVAERAVAEFGSLDVWVNNAAVVAYGRTEETPVPVWHRVIEVNLFGYYHGVRAAVPWFREQGHGVLINVSSMLGKTPSPHQSAYVVSKQGIRALSDCVRQEVADLPGISVCTVLPGAIDTPIFRTGANVSGYQIQPAGPPIDARRVAGAIVRCARRPHRREVAVGAATRVGLAATRLVPGLTERVFGRLVERAHFLDEPAARTEGNVFTPSGDGGSVDGGWRHNGWQPPSPPGRRWLAGAAAATAVAAAGALAVRRLREGN
ncbi:SDR family NAD(P)-dependent oxidoreductase [Natronosporangium hydrolyticum]|uniref:SDR family NAD(P)-dependent oxidoreductase n=1 Tax=Natronosporangium hydrolyticum TaxID=2811111 RepID=A0A895YLV0_9ACTN|nr:SDR family NAD(P)-dependent oxidoreductase [Natronosporangium hydrolyticum]QSB16293.1 SDR family NAD(P)-dependent oxidoreductase [Natronosporangium hydrolyticum]